MLTYLRYYLNRQKHENLQPELPTLEEIKQNYIRYILDISQNDLEKAAGILDVSPALIEKQRSK